MPRLFFALWPDDATRTKLNHVAQKINNEKIHCIKPANLHITLVFLGEVSVQDQQRLIQDVTLLKNNSFELVLTHIDCWKQPGILFIGANQIPEPLMELMKSIRQICDTIGLKTDKRPYKPHITIARNVKRKIKLTMENIKWDVSSFVLVESVFNESGVDYRVIKEWLL